MIVGSSTINFLEIKLKYTLWAANLHKVHPNAPFPFGQNCPRKIAVSMSISRSTPNGSLQKDIRGAFVGQDQSRDEP